MNTTSASPTSRGAVTRASQAVPFGVYEKALPEGGVRTMLEAAAAAGFDFLELSIDESDERLERLHWSTDQRSGVVRACRSVGVPIFSLCLSGHRRFGLGSACAETRARAAIMLDQAVGLAADLGARVVQVAGYYAYYETVRPADARMRYIEGLHAGLGLAAARGVMLAVENIDTSDMASSEQMLQTRSELSHPWFQLYPDAGNFAVHELDVAESLTRVLPHAVGLHLKDTRPGAPRRVAFGEGIVPFHDVFRVIAESRYRGPLTIEMWNEDQGTATSSARDALRWLRQRMQATYEEHEA